MTVKCTFCNDTKQEPGEPGRCVWCETAADSIAFGTGIMLVGADGAKNVPLGDFLVETKAFRLLPYGTKFRYQGTQDVWVRIGHNLLAKWPCDLFGRDGQPCQSLCSFCHLEGDDSGDTLDTLVEVVDAELSLSAERDAALAREAALREELETIKRVGPPHFCGLPMSLNPHAEAGKPDRILEVGAHRECIPCLVSSRHWWAKTAGELQQRLTVAEQDAAELRDCLNGTLEREDSCKSRISELEGLLNDLIRPRSPQERISIKRHEAMCRALAALKPAAEAAGSTCNQIREESGLPTKNPCVACNNGACIDR